MRLTPTIAISPFVLGLAMPQDSEKLSPAVHEEVAESIAFSLRFNGRKRFHEGHELMAEITAQHVLRHLERCGFVLMKRPPIRGSAPLNPPESYPQTKPEDLK
jgi:hypothetical protein